MKHYFVSISVLLHKRGRWINMVIHESNKEYEVTLEEELDTLVNEFYQSSKYIINQSIV
jgi:hypothetical protein